MKNLSERFRMRHTANTQTGVRNQHGQRAGKPSGIGVEPKMRDYFLSFFASSVIAWPALDTSLPAPSTVLHALKNVDAPVRTTKPMRAIVSFLRMTTPLVL